MKGTWIIKKCAVIVILSSIILFLFVNNFLWLKEDNLIQGSDAGWHFMEVVKFRGAFLTIAESHAPFFVKIVRWVQTFGHWGAMGNWPPLIYFLTALASPNGVHLFSARLYVNFIFYVLLILSTYFLGKKCFNRRAGLIAAFIVSFYPAVCAFSRQLGLDFPLLCVTAVCVCLLAYTEDYAKRGYSLWFGLALGLGTLVKLQVLFFLFTPLLFAMMGLSHRNRQERFRGFLNFILSAIIAAGLCLLCWGHRIVFSLHDIYNHTFLYYPFYQSQATVVSPVAIPILSLRNLTYYLEGLLAHVYLAPLLLFAGALIAMALSKNKWRFFWILGFLVPYLLFTLISVKWIRYVLPLVFFMAIVSGWGIDRLRPWYVKGLALCLLLIYSFGLFFTCSWNVLKWDWLRPFYLERLALPDSHFPGLNPPESYDFIGELNNAGILPSIERGLREGKTLSMASLGDNSGILVLFYLRFQDAIFNKRFIVYDRIEEDLPDVDYVIIKESELATRKGLLARYNKVRWSQAPGFRDKVCLVKK